MIVKYWYFNFCQTLMNPDSKKGLHTNNIFEQNWTQENTKCWRWKGCVKYFLGSVSQMVQLCDLLIFKLWALIPVAIDPLYSGNSMFPLQHGQTSHVLLRACGCACARENGIQKQVKPSEHRWDFNAAQWWNIFWKRPLKPQMLQALMALNRAWMIVKVF